MGGERQYPERLWFRAAEGTKEQIEIAATECELRPGEWIRAVVDSALEVHMSQTTEAEEVEVPDALEDPEDYIRQVEADARAAREADPPAGTPRVQHPGLHEEAPRSPQERPDPKTCPHPPQWRQGARCRCGTVIGASRVRAAGAGFRR